jgi:anti-sigma B factor antagonist
MPDEQTNLTITERGDVAVVEFQDRKILEELLITKIGDQLTELAASKPSIRLLLSFRNVEHLSSAALGMLITLHHQIKKKDGRLMLADINPQIFQVFEITKLNRLFEIFPTSEQALAKA